MDYYIPSSWRRLGARILDFIFLTFISTPLLAMAPVSQDGWIVLSIPAAAILLLIPFIYEAMGYYFFNATLGKWVMGLRIVPARSGGQESWFWSSILRSASGYLTMFFSWAVYATALWRYDRRHLLDMFSETRVVAFHKGRLTKTYPIRGILLVLIGLDYGWHGAIETIHSVHYQGGKFLIPQAVSFELTVEDI